VTPAPKCRWSYSLRTLFVVVTVVGCWLSYEVNWMRERHAYVLSQREKFRDIGFDMHVYAASNWVRAPHGTWLFGESGVATLVILFPNGEREREFQRAQRLFPESKIMIMGEQTTGRPIAGPPATAPSFSRSTLMPNSSPR
jgi:hypothetical protein